MLNIKNEVIAAEKRIRPFVRDTQLDYSVSLSKSCKANIFLKCENLQYTHSFKIRGAFNKLLGLTDAERARGIVTASSGNHGAAVAYGLQKLSIPGVIFVPEQVAQAKVENILRYHSKLMYFGTDCMHTELHAIEYAKQNNMVYISPYNDLQVIAGQGTLGVELINTLTNIDAILVPIGGGGLISGLAGFIKAVSPQTKIIGCMPEHSPVMSESIKAGYIIDMATYPTLSDATAGGIEPGSITFDFCREYVDEYILVTEDEIANAITTLLKTEKLLVEGAAGVALASFLKSTDKFNNKNIVIIVSGGNISLETLRLLLN